MNKIFPIDLHVMYLYFPDRHRKSTLRYRILLWRGRVFV